MADEKVEAVVRITLTQAQVQALRWAFEQAELHRQEWESEFVLPSLRTTARIGQTRAQHAAAARVADEVLGQVAGVWDEEEEGELPISYLDRVDGHWYVVQYNGLDPLAPRIHALDCETCAAAKKEE